MRRWLNRRTGLERQLRGYRAEPGDEFIANLSQRLTGNMPGTQRPRSRLAFAGAISVFILGTFASFGGLSYAASGAAGSYHTVKQVAVDHTLFVSVNKSSATDQYSPKPKPKPKAKPKPKHHQKSHTATGVAGVQDAVIKSSGTLPFTGISLLTTFVVSLALIVGGIMLRRRERRN
jgi:hypothetical protein